MYADETTLPVYVCHLLIARNKNSVASLITYEVGKDMEWLNINTLIQRKI